VGQGILGRRRIRGYIISLSLLMAVLAFQNCSGGFKALDSSSNLTDAGELGDQTPPTAPQNPIALSNSPNAVVVTWESATDDTAIAGYRIYQNGSLTGTVASSANQYAVNGLSASTTYSFYIVAFDAAGNISSPSSLVTATTTTIILIPPGIRTANVNVQEGAAAVVMIERTGTGSPALNLNWVITSALSPAGDVTALSGSLIFPASSPSISFSIQTVDDNVVEGTEQLIVTITEAVSAVPVLTMTLTIIDNEPTTIADLKPGEWYEVPNSKIAAVAPSPLPPGSLAAVVSAWSGGAYDTKRDRYIVTGGGHGDYSGNELYIFDLKTLQWSRPWGPSALTDIPPCPDLPIWSLPTNSASRLGSQYKVEGAIVEGPVAADGFKWWRVDFDSGVDGWAMEHYLERITITPAPSGLKFAIGDRILPITAGREEYLDGTPASRHSYNGLDYLPNIDRLFVNGGSLWGGSGGMGVAAWLFDFVALKWTRTSDSQFNTIPYAAYDPVTKSVFTHRYARFYEHDVVADTWVVRGSYGPGISGNFTSVIDPITRKFILIGSGVFAWYDMTQAGNWELTFVPTTGDTAPNSGNSPGLAYDPTTQRVIAWIGGTDVYSLNTTTRVWKKLPAAASNMADPGLPTHTGTNGRFRYIPSKNLFIVVNSVTSNVFLYKLAPNP
jgi:hypothetical protein